MNIKIQSTVKVNVFITKQKMAVLDVQFVVQNKEEGKMKQLMFVVMLLTSLAFGATKSVATKALVAPTVQQKEQIKRAQAFNAQRFNPKPSMPTFNSPDITIIDGGVSSPVLEAEGFIEYHGSVLAVGGDIVNH
jgi:hypothetical protein